MLTKGHDYNFFIRIWYGSLNLTIVVGVSKQPFKCPQLTKVKLKLFFGPGYFFSPWWSFASGSSSLLTSPPLHPATLISTSSSSTWQLLHSLFFRTQTCFEERIFKLHIYESKSSAVRDKIYCKAKLNLPYLLCLWIGEQNCLKNLAFFSLSHDWMLKLVSIVYHHSPLS